MTIEISEANIQDCDEIILLQKLAYESEAQLYQDWTITPLTQSSAALAQEFPQLMILKAIQAGGIIGSVRAQLINNVCHIGRLIVHPDYQRQGIGTELLKSIEAHYKDVTHYELFTGDKSLGNIRLYQREGYSITHTKPLSEKTTLVFLRKTAKT